MKQNIVSAYINVFATFQTMGRFSELGSYIHQHKTLYKYYVSGHYPSSCLYQKHPPVYITKHNVSETGFCLCLQVKTGWWIMSRNIMFVLMYHRHRLLDFIYETPCIVSVASYPILTVVPWYCVDSEMAVPFRSFKNSWCMLKSCDKHLELERTCRHNWKFRLDWLSKSRYNWDWGTLV
jgi:hypothetical protein